MPRKRRVLRSLGRATRPSCGCWSHFSAPRSDRRHTKLADRPWARSSRGPRAVRIARRSFYIWTPPPRRATHRGWPANGVNRRFKALSTRYCGASAGKRLRCFAPTAAFAQYAAWLWPPGPAYVETPRRNRPCPSAGPPLILLESRSRLWAQRLEATLLPTVTRAHGNWPVEAVRFARAPVIQDGAALPVRRFSGRRQTVIDLCSAPSFRPRSCRSRGRVTAVDRPPAAGRLNSSYPLNLAATLDRRLHPVSAAGAGRCRAVVHPARLPVPSAPPMSPG